MKTTPAPIEPPPCKSISMGLTCWLWQRRTRTILQLAQRTEVTLRLTERIHGLRREIECQVWGRNPDRFIGEFFRHC